MRPLARFSVLMPILFAINLSPLQAHSVNSATPPAVDQSPKFRQIHMVSKTNGWAFVTVDDPAGAMNEIPDQIYDGTIGYIVHTQDGGKTWENVTPPISGNSIPWPTCDCTNNGIAGFFFLDDLNAWVLTDDAGLPNNQLYYGMNIWQTIDGGKTWLQSMNALDAVSVMNIQFVDPSHGWLLLGSIPTENLPESPALLFRTTNGSRSWQLNADDGITKHRDGTAPISKQESGIVAGIHTGMAFDSARSGWLTWSAGDPPNGGLLHTVDGGRTWSTIPMPPDSPLADPMSDCGMSSPQVPEKGIVTFLAYCYFANHAAGDIYKSTDEGKNWQIISLPEHTMPHATLFTPAPQVIMIDGKTGWLVKCEPASDATACDKSTPTLVLYQTVDSAKTWTKVSPLPAELTPLFDVHDVSRLDFIDSNLGWAVDNAGKLLATNDGGKSWRGLAATVLFK